MYVSIEHKGRVREILSQWPLSAEARIAVVTDGMSYNKLYQVQV